MQEQGEEGGNTHQPEGEVGAPPKQARTPFVRVLIQERGGKLLELSIPLSPLHVDARERGEGVKARKAPESWRAHQPH